MSWTSATKCSNSSVSHPANIRPFTIRSMSDDACTFRLCSLAPLFASLRPDLGILRSLLSACDPHASPRPRNIPSTPFDRVGMRNSCRSGGGKLKNCEWLSCRHRLSAQENHKAGGVLAAFAFAIRVPFLFCLLSHPFYLVCLWTKLLTSAPSIRYAS